MKKIFNYILALTFIFSFSIITSCGEKKEEAKPSKEEPKVELQTMMNLIAAFNGESNAHAKYVEYAKRADEDRFTQVASLFRAAARAEEIHFQNHAKVIKKMGGTPTAEIKLPETKSTKENLEDAIKGESYERDTMYPEFLTVARKEKNKDAIETFNFALEAEKDHAKLYTQTLNELKKWEIGKIDFLVCPTCGHTIFANEKFDKCPVCYTKPDKFIAIN